MYENTENILGIFVCWVGTWKIAKRIMLKMKKSLSNSKNSNVSLIVVMVMDSASPYSCNLVNERKFLSPITQ